MKILALILAAGEGSRIKHLLEPDEKIKAMLKVGDKRLIENVMDSLDGVEVDKAVLTFPDEKYKELNDLVRHRNIPLLTQKAKHRKLPTLLELPYILMWQYNFSKDSKFLKQYDAILTMPCDLLFKNLDLKGLIDLYRKHKDHPKKKRLAIISKRADGGGRCDLFKKDDDRIMDFKKYEGENPDNWDMGTQAGIYIFSKGLLKNPIPFLVGVKHILALQYFVQEEWEDFGDPERVKQLKGIV